MYVRKQSEAIINRCKTCGEEIHTTLDPAGYGHTPDCADFGKEWAEDERE